MRTDDRLLAPRRRRDAVMFGEPSSTAGAVLALQRSAGNSATTKAVEAAAQSDIDLDFPGIGEHIPVDSFQLETGRHGEIVGVSINRRIDAYSSLFMRANVSGEAVRASLVAGRRGSSRHMVLRLEGCLVTSYLSGGESERITFSFTRVDFEQ
jgi:hypothetical protein